MGFDASAQHVKNAGLVIQCFNEEFYIPNQINCYRNHSNDFWNTVEYTVHVMIIFVDGLIYLSTQKKK